MEVRMTNARIILWTLIISLILILGFSYYKINKEKHEEIYKVINKKIIDRAKDCVHDDKCGANMTLGELINNGYLDPIVDPDTKEYYNRASTIKIENGNYIFTPSY